ncbi:MAG TPA: hypothetical protein VK179_18125 [Bacteroidales bacterium]|nr:hypothetical protein [Bacteroidales bacterium]
MRAYQYKNKSLSIVLIAFSILSCDPAIQYEYYVKNDSNREFQIGFSAPGLEYERMEHDSIVSIKPNTKSLIVKFDMWGSHPHDEGVDFLNVFDTIYVVNRDSIELLKDITIRQNWVYDNDIAYFGLIKTGTNIYTLNINEQDFNNK